jgi:hypothetical protein
MDIAMAIAMHTLTIFLAVPDAQDIQIFFQDCVSHNVIACYEVLCAGQLFHVNPHLRLIGQAINGSYQAPAYLPGGLWIVFSDKITQAHQIPL